MTDSDKLLQKEMSYSDFFQYNIYPIFYSWKDICVTFPSSLEKETITLYLSEEQNSYYIECMHNFFKYLFLLLTYSYVL